MVSYGAEIIARHVRSTASEEDFVFDPLHYLALLERKIGALDQAAPLAGWELPEAFSTLRRLLKRAWAKQGMPSSYKCCGCWRCSAETSLAGCVLPSSAARSALTR